MWCVYVLKSKIDNKSYIGSTDDLKRRFNQHNKGHVSSTKHRMPWKLIYYEAYISETSARTREKKLKQFGSAYQELKKRVPEMI